MKLDSDQLTANQVKETLKEQSELPPSIKTQSELKRTRAESPSSTKFDSTKTSQPTSPTKTESSTVFSDMGTLLIYCIIVS